MATDAFDPEPKFTLDAVPSEPLAEVRWRTPKPRQLPNPAVATSVVLAVIVGVTACYLLWPRGVNLAPPNVSAPTVSSAPPPGPTESTIQHPVEQIPSSAGEEVSATRQPLPG